VPILERLTRSKVIGRQLLGRALSLLQVLLFVVAEHALVLHRELDTLP
jgi:hypothetical protein